MAQKPKPIRERGTIEVLPSGSLRVTVYAGTDKRTGARNNLSETVKLAKDAPAKEMKAALKRAEEIRRRLVTQVEEKRHPRTNATVDELLDKYFALPASQRRVEPETVAKDAARARNHIRPLIGRVKVADLDAEVFDTFYGELLRCRRHCRAKQEAHRSPRAGPTRLR